MIIARQSTAIIVTVGPVLDASGVAVTDGDFKRFNNGYNVSGYVVNPLHGIPQCATMQKLEDLLVRLKLQNNDSGQRLTKLKPAGFGQEEQRLLAMVFFGTANALLGHTVSHTNYWLARLKKTLTSTIYAETLVVLTLLILRLLVIRLMSQEAMPGRLQALRILQKLNVLKAINTRKTIHTSTLALGNDAVESAAVNGKKNDGGDS